MTQELETQEKTENIDISTVNGRTQIVFKKAILKGKVSSGDVLNTILIAARMQAEKYIEKLSRGAPLEVAEVKALRELAEITKLELPQVAKPEGTLNGEVLQSVKTTLYQALTDKLSNPKDS
jgi:molybdenum cofactor biosynthesis enzyme